MIERAGIPWNKSSVRRAAFSRNQRRRAFVQPFQISGTIGTWTSLKIRSYHHIPKLLHASIIRSTECSCKTEAIDPKAHFPLKHYFQYRFPRKPVKKGDWIPLNVWNIWVSKTTKPSVARNIFINGKIWNFIWISSISGIASWILTNNINFLELNSDSRCSFCWWSGVLVYLMLKWGGEPIKYQLQYRRSCEVADAIIIVHITNNFHRMS